MGGKPVHMGNNEEAGVVITHYYFTVGITTLNLAQLRSHIN